MTVSERLWSCSGPSPLAHHGDLRSSQWSKLQKFHRPPFDWTAKSLLWCSLRCVEWKATTVTWILRRCHPEKSLCFCEFGRRSFIKHAPWRVFFLIILWKNFVLLSTIRPDFTKHFTFTFRMRPNKLQAKALNSTFRSISVWKLLQIGNFDGLTILTALVLFNQSDYLNHSNKVFDWPVVACSIRVYIISSVMHAFWLFSLMIYRRTDV